MWDQPAFDYDSHTFTYGQVLMAGAASYAAYKSLLMLNQKRKEFNTTALGRETLRQRNAKHFKFNTSGIDVARILSLDCQQLREELIKGTFTSVDLV